MLWLKRLSLYITFFITSVFIERYFDISHLKGAVNQMWIRVYRIKVSLLMQYHLSIWLLYLLHVYYPLILIHLLTHMLLFSSHLAMLAITHSLFVALSFSLGPLYCLSFFYLRLLDAPWCLLDAPWCLMDAPWCLRTLFKICDVIKASAWNRSCAIIYLYHK